MLSASPTKKWGYYSQFSIKRKHHLLSYSQISIVSGPKKCKKEVRKLLYLFIYFRARKLLHQANIFILMPFANERYINEF